MVFPAAPKPNPEAQKADKELDETLRQRVTGCYTSLLHACSYKHRRGRTDEYEAGDVGCSRNDSNDARG